MPDCRVTLPLFRRVLLLCLSPLLLPCLPSRAQEPGRRVSPPAARVAARTASGESAEKRTTVTIPRDEYERLKAAARAAAERHVARSAVVTEAHYTAEVADGTAKIGCRLVVQVLKGTWAEIPLNFGEAAVGLLVANKGTTAFLRGHENGRFTLSVKESGRHEIRLELQAKVKPQSAGSGFSFAGPPAGISTLDVVIPESGQQIAVSPTFVPERAAAQPGTSRVKGHLAAASRMTVSWQAARVSDGTSTIFDIDNRTRIRLHDASLVTESRLNCRVQRGRLATLQIIAPAKERILDVSADGGVLSGWTVSKQKGMQQIRVAFSRPIADRVAVIVRTERDLSEGTVYVAGIDGKGNACGIHAADSSRETGLLVLSHVPRWEVSVPSQPGWVPLESTEIPGEAATAGMQYVRYFHPKTPFSIHVQPVKPRISVTHDARVAVGPSQVDVTSRLQFQVDRIGVSSLSLRLPSGMTVDRVAGEHVKSFAVAGSPSLLKVTFDRRVTGRTDLSVRAHRRLADAAQPGEFALPLPEPEAVDRESGRVELFAPDAVEVSAVSDKTSGVTPTALAAGVWGTRSASSRQDSRSESPTLVAAWSFDARPMQITVKMKNRTPRMTARLGTRIDVRDSNVGITSHLEYHVAHAPTASFRFAVPTAVAGSVRVTDAAGNALSVRNVGPGEKWKAESGKRKAESKIPLPLDSRLSTLDTAWTVLEIESPQPASGVHRFRLQYELELAKPANGGQPLLVHPPRVLRIGAGEVSGEVTVARAPSFKLKITARGGDVEPADGRELSFLKAIDGEHYRYHREPVSLAIGIAKLEVETVAETVVSRGLVEILLAGDANASYRARYRVLSSERQRLRLDLPKSCEPLGVFVNGSPVALERDATEKESEEWNSFLINVSRRQPSDEPFSLVIHFRMPVKPAPFQVPLGRLRLNLPQVRNPSGSSAVVQQLRTVVWVPQGIALHGEADGFTRRTTTRLTGFGPGSISSRVNSDALEKWIAVESPGVFEFPTQGHAYEFAAVGAVEQLEIATADMPFATWLLGVPLLLMGLVLARTTWHNRMNLLLLLVFAGTVAAVTWSDATYHALLASRYGLAGAAVLWVIHGVFAARSPRPTLPARRSDPCPLPIAGLASVVIPPPGLFTEKS